MSDPIESVPVPDSTPMPPLPSATASPLAYDDTGSGRPVVLIHAFPLDRTMWRRLLRHMTGQQLRLVVPDLRGFGDSPPTHGEPMAMGGYGDDIVALLDRLGLERATLCGLSMGGYVALAIAQRHPERVEALVLANTRATADDDAARAKRRQLAARVAEEGMGRLASDLVAKLLGPTATAGSRSLVRNTIRRQEPHGAASALRGMAARADRSELLAKLAVPTLVITSEHDQLVPPEASRAMAAAIPGSTLIEIPAAGHLSAIEEPAAFALALASHLQSLGRT